MFLSELLHHNEPTRFIRFSSSEIHYLIYIKFLLTCGLSAVVQSVWKCARSTTIVLLGCFLKCLHNWKWCMSWANGLLPDYRALGHLQHSSNSWWRHQIETFSALLAICAGNSPTPVNSPHKGQWRGALMFSLICVWINVWVNNREAGDLRRYRVNYGVIVM